MERRLGSIEQSWTLAGEFQPLAAVAVLHLLNGPDPAVLRQALQQLQLGQPLLNVKIVPRNGHYYFEPAPEPAEIPLELIERQDEQQWRHIAADALNKSFDIDASPLMRCVYLYQQGQDKQSELVLTHHHATMDAISGVHFYDQLLALCAGLGDGSSQAEQPLLPPLDQLFPPAMNGIRRAGRLIQYFWRQIGDEIRYRRQLGSGRRAPVHPDSRCMILTRTLDPAATKALVRASRRYRMTMGNVVSTAMLLAVRKHLYQDQPVPLRSISFADLRPYLQPPPSPDTLGCYISMLRYTANLSPDGDFWPSVRAVQETSSLAIRRGEKYLAALMSKPLMKTLIRFQPFRLGAAAVSYAGALNLQPSYGQIQLTGLNAFISNNRVGPEYTAFTKILFGQLSWDLLYLDSDMDPPTADAIADEITAILLRAGAEVPQPNY